MRNIERKIDNKSAFIKGAVVTGLCGVLAAVVYHNNHPRQDYIQVQSPTTETREYVAPKWEVPERIDTNQYIILTVPGPESMRLIEEEKPKINYLNKLNLKGIFDTSGTDLRPSAIVNEKVCHVGDILEGNLKILEIDGANKSLVIEDVNSGEILRKGFDN